MDDFKVIGEIGERMKHILETDPWKGMNKPEIVFQSPNEIGDMEGVNKVSIFLFNIVENCFLKNQEPTPRKPGNLKNPPLILDLYYLITAYRSDAIQEHYILGKVMQIFHEHPIIADSNHQGSLSGTDMGELRVLLQSLTVDDLSRLWKSFQNVSLRPSVCYCATPIIIEST